MTIACRAGTERATADEWVRLRWQVRADFLALPVHEQWRWARAQERCGFIKDAKFGRLMFRSAATPVVSGISGDKEMGDHAVSEMAAMLVTS